MPITNTSQRISQEFYCSPSGGGCGMYFDVRLNIAINRSLTIVCPKCGHEHCRKVSNGVIKESGREVNSELVRPTKVSLRSKPITQTMLANTASRDGAVHDEISAQRRLFDAEMWQNLTETEKGDY